MAPERLNGSNYSYGADIWHASPAQSGIRRSGMPQGVAGYHPVMRQRRSSAAPLMVAGYRPKGWLVITHRSSPSPSPSPSPPPSPSPGRLASSCSRCCSESSPTRTRRTTSDYSRSSWTRRSAHPIPNPKTLTLTLTPTLTLTHHGRGGTVQHTHTGVRAHTALGPCTPSAWARLRTAAAPFCSTPAAPLQHPCSTPAVPLQRPCWPLQRPCSTPAAPLQRPCSAACLIVHCVVTGAERAREYLLERARRVCQLVPEQERDQAPERQRLVETPLVAQAPYRRHAALRVAREDDAMIGLLVSRLEESLDRNPRSCALEMHTLIDVLYFFFKRYGIT